MSEEPEEHSEPARKSRRGNWFHLHWLLLIVLLSGWIGVVNERHVTGDAVDYLRGAYNIYKHNTFSRDGSSSPKPGNYREPGFSFYMAVSMHAHPSISPSIPMKAFLRDGKVIRDVKAAHVLSFLLLVLLTASSAYLLGVRGWALPLSYLLVGLSYTFTEHINSGYAEVLSAFLVLWLANALYRATKHLRMLYWIESGAVLAAAALTKAVFLYLFPVVFFFLAAVALSRNWSLRNPSWRLLAGFTLAGALPISMWMIRNEIAVGDRSISQRGGQVMAFRAGMNDMTLTESFGAFYVWTRDPIFRKAVGRFLGFNEDDLKEGGRLYRISRQESYYRALVTYRQMRAEQGWVKADDQLFRDAFGSIVANPLKHLWTTIPLLWRGVFVEEGLFLFGKNRIFQYCALLNLLYSISLFLGLWMSISRRDWPWLAFLLPGVYLVIMNAAATENIPRYNQPAIPIMALSSLLALQAGVSFLREKLAG